MLGKVWLDILWRVERDRERERGGGEKQVLSNDYHYLILRAFNWGTFIIKETSLRCRAIYAQSEPVQLFILHICIYIIFHIYIRTYSFHNETRLKVDNISRNCVAADDKTKERLIAQRHGEKGLYLHFFAYNCKSPSIYQIPIGSRIFEFWRTTSIKMT